MTDTPPEHRPLLLHGRTLRVETGCGKLYVTLNRTEDGRPYEVFARIGKAGGCAASQTEAVTRLISRGLRRGLDIHDLVDQLKGIRCHQPYTDHKTGTEVSSCADALSRALIMLLMNSNGNTE